MNYFELQQALFNYLLEKHQKDPHFTFSVRRKATKGAEKNHFIGTERSKYFAFTCWDIPVYYAGSSGDLTGFIFMKDEGGNWRIKFQYGMSKDAKGEQNEANLAFGAELLGHLKSAKVPLWLTDEGNKMLYYHVQPSDESFSSFDDIIKQLEIIYSFVASEVDKAIKLTKEKFPNWQAERFQLQKFDRLVKKMHDRIQRFSNAPVAVLDELPIEEELDVPKGEEVETSYPLNQILYGPPGTGKTYHTIDKALSILVPDYYKQFQSNRKKLTEKFNELLITDWESGKGQIAFTTFHQSMSYEDFIEGIKPQQPDPGEPLSYDIEGGIFKSICRLARSNYESSRMEQQLLPFEEVFERFKQSWEDEPNQKFPLKTSGYDFKILGFTKTSIRFEKASGGTGHTLSINTLREQYYGKKYDFKQGVGIYYPSVLEKLFSFSKSAGKKVDALNYVIIIDEINRGNVSQIFGEAITLIEDDKRIGETEAVEVMLPYSKESFGVPRNLYIVGTMNTADRSVEALDTALRRRFVFEELMPKPHLLAPNALVNNFYLSLHSQRKNIKEVKPRFEAFSKLIGLAKNAEENIWTRIIGDNSDLGIQVNIEFINEQDISTAGIDLHKMLLVINERLATLLSRDHTIGHAWLMGIYSFEDLQRVFKNKIIPLLQEYFYNNYVKIGLVLGDQFVQLKQIRNNLFASFPDEQEITAEYQGRTGYTIADPLALDIEAYRSIYE